MVNYSECIVCLWLFPIVSQILLPLALLTVWLVGRVPYFYWWDRDKHDSTSPP